MLADAIVVAVAVAAPRTVGTGVRPTTGVDLTAVGRTIEVGATVAGTDVGRVTGVRPIVGVLAASVGRLVAEDSGVVLEGVAVEVVSAVSTVPVALDEGLVASILGVTVTSTVPSHAASTNTAAASVSAVILLSVRGCFKLASVQTQLKVRCRGTGVPFLEWKH